MCDWCSGHTHRDHQGRHFTSRGQDALQSQCLGQTLLHTAQSAPFWKALEHLLLFNAWFLQHKRVSYVTEAVTATAPCRRDSNDQVSSNPPHINSLAQSILALATAPQAVIDLCCGGHNESTSKCRKVSTDGQAVGSTYPSTAPTALHGTAWRAPLVDARHTWPWRSCHQPPHCVVASPRDPNTPSLLCLREIPLQQEQECA